MKQWAICWLTICFFMTDISCEFAPTVKFEKCTGVDIQLTLSGAANGGIIYIRGGQASCIRETTNETTFHVFGFDACMINPNEEYFVCVQRNPLYQTDQDLVLHFACHFDLTEIKTVSVNADQSSEDDAGVNKTIQPTVSMKLYKNGYDVSGGDVKLGDPITMIISMDEQFTDNFDFKVRHCTASTIPIVENFCASETELFPDFSRLQNGSMTSSFNAFRTTTLTNVQVTMTFSCTLELCLGPCNDEACGPRRKRDTDLKTKSREKRAVEELLGHSYIGNRYTVSRLTTIIKTSDPNKACVHFAIIFLLFPTLTIVAVSLVTYSLILYRSYRQQVILQSEILNSRTASNVSMGPKIEDTAI